MGGAPHGLRKPGEQEVPEGYVGAGHVMRHPAAHARAAGRQRVPRLCVEGSGAEHDADRE